MLPLKSNLPRIALIVLLILALGAAADCKRGQNPLKKFNRQTTFDPCNPAFDFYEGDTHYFERDFVNEDGTMDYAKWFQSRELQSSDCDPLKRSKTGPKQTSPVLPATESQPRTEADKVAPVKSSESDQTSH